MRRNWRGKVSLFFAAATPASSKFFILTDHKTTSTRVATLLNPEEFNPILQGNLQDLKQYLFNSDSSTPIIFLATTYPQRFVEWLKLILQDQEIKSLLEKRQEDILFFLPHLPNEAVQILRQENFAIIAADYYQGIGGVRHNAEDQISYVEAGVKEMVLLAYENTEKFIAKHRHFQDLIKHLTLNQTIFEGFKIEEIELIPTNAILHLAGMSAHVAQALIDKGLCDKEIMQSSTSQEFFARLESVLQGKNALELVGSSLKGVGFYRHMPAIAPDILMKEIGSIVCQIRQKMIENGHLRQSSLDQNTEIRLPFSHIFCHLRSKYAGIYKELNGENVVDVSFSKFINNNPRYQNPAIVIPLDTGGKINTNHRFFTEELPTFKNLQKLARHYKISEKELMPLNKCINFAERLMSEKVGPGLAGNLKAVENFALMPLSLRSKL